MSSTKWSSLTEFAKYLGHEGICRVEENDKGIHIAWNDTSPEALKRQEALRRKEAQDKGDEEWQQRMLKEQIKRAQRDAKARGVTLDEDDADDQEGGLLQPRQEGEEIKLSFGVKPALSTTKPEPTAQQEKADSPVHADTTGSPEKRADESTSGDQKADGESADAPPLSLKIGAMPQSKNVFARKNALAGSGKKRVIEQPKKMSEAERIMKEELDRKRGRESLPFGGLNKRRKM